MKKLISLTCFLSLLITTPAFAEPYGTYDLNKILLTVDTPSGKKREIDLRYLGTMINDLAIHAKTYPVQFDSDADRGRAYNDLASLSNLMDMLTNGPNPNPELLLRSGLVHNMAHNVGLPDEMKKAVLAYDRLLRTTPDHPKGNYFLGALLADAGKYRLSIPYLEKAFQLGELNAGFTLGVVYIALDEKNNAIASLENYLKKLPDDTTAQQLLAGVKSGQVKASVR